MLREKLNDALKDAMRWSRVARNVADAADPPSPGSTRSPRPAAWTSEQLASFLEFIAGKCFEVLKRLKVRQDIRDRLITEFRRASRHVLRASHAGKRVDLLILIV